MSNIRNCESCGNQLMRKTMRNNAIEKQSRFLKRRYCDNKCKGKSQQNDKSIDVDSAISFCKNCGMPIVRIKRKDGQMESPCQFATRLFCSQSCASQSRKAATSERMSTRQCAACGKVLMREMFPSGVLEATTKFENRKYCSCVCAGKGRMRTMDTNVKERVCRQCGNTLVRQIRANGYLEAVELFEARNYCSHICAGVHLRANPDMQSTGACRHTARRKKGKGNCELCGHNGVHVHHIDCNPYNNRIDNLIRLCAKCHGSEHIKINQSRTQHLTLDR